MKNTEKQLIRQLFDKIIEKNVKSDEWIIKETNKSLAEEIYESREEAEETLCKTVFHLDLLRLHQDKAFVDALPLEQLLKVMDECVDNIQEAADYL